MRVAWILLAIGCTGAPSDLASSSGTLQDGDWFQLDPAELSDPNDPAPGEPGHYQLSCAPSSWVETPELTASGGPGQIEVLHTGVWSACSTSWRISGSVEGDVIEMSYEQFYPVEDGCTCQNDVHYTIPGVPDGDWTVRAEGLDVQVTVPAE